MDKLKIFISCGSYSWGGLEMVTLQNARELKNSGHNVNILCASGSRIQQEAAANDISAIPVFTKDARIFSAIVKMRNTIQKFKPHIIHTHLSHDLWTLTPALRLSRSGARLFLTKHIASGVKKSDVFHRFLYNRVSGIFAISSYIYETVVNTCPVPTEKIHLLPNGINLNDYNKESYDKTILRKKYNIPENKIVISIIGRFTPGKGHIEFLNAAKILNEKLGDKIFFLAAGSASHGEQEYEQKVRAMAVELNIKNLLFTGYINPIQEILALTDILAFPSHNESFGVALIEAMAMQVPAVAADYGGVLDIITGNQNGLLVEPRNYKELAQELLKLINDESLRTRFGNEGRKTVEEKFDIKKIINKLTEHYTSE